MQGQRRQQGRPAEPRATGGRAEGLDVNRERLIFCATSLVGHTVTVKLRNNVLYEGLFHSCSLDGDYSITLKCARRLHGDCPSAESIPTLVIPGKDFLQVSATNLPSPRSLAGDENSSPSNGNKSFATDSEIAAKRHDGVGGQRKLIPWNGGDSSGTALEGSLESSSKDRNWDQFAANRELFGVVSTYSEEQYTTPLNPDLIPREKRESADRIAREVESGQAAADVENNGDEDDEESKFSAVGGHGKKDQSAQAKAGARSTALATATPTQQNLGRSVDAFANFSADSLSKDPRKTRGMVSEMKRINALNLEPTIPKAEDQRGTRLNFRESQVRGGASRTSQPSGDLKAEFQQSLEKISKQAAMKEQKMEAANANMRSQQGSGDNSSNWSIQQHQQQQQQQQQQGMQMFQGKGQQQQQQQMQGGGYPGQMVAQGGQRQGGGGFTFNASASEFKMNPQAGEFTPGGSSGNKQQQQQQQQQQMVPQQQQQQQQQQQVSKHDDSKPHFSIQQNSFARKPLAQILEPLYASANRNPPETIRPDWPDAQGTTYREVLGQPLTANSAARPSVMQAIQAPAQGAPGSGPWVQPHGPAPGPDQNPPQMQGIAPMQGMMPMGQMGAIHPGMAMQQMQGGHPQTYVQGGQGGPMGNMQAMPKFGNGQHMVMMPVMMAGPNQGQFVQQGFQQMQQPGGPGGPPGPVPQGDGSQQQLMQQHMYQRQHGSG